MASTAHARSSGRRRPLGNLTNDGSTAARDAKNHCKSGTVREIAAKFRGASTITTEQRLRDRERHERLEHRHRRCSRGATGPSTWRGWGNNSGKLHKGTELRACRKDVREHVAEDSFDGDALFDEMLGMIHVGGRDSDSDGGSDRDSDGNIDSDSEGDSNGDSDKNNDD